MNHYPLENAGWAGRLQADNPEMVQAMKELNGCSRARLHPLEAGGGRRQFLALVDDVRPNLHRYCARMTGSITDGEDVVEDTLARAYYELFELKELPALRHGCFVSPTTVVVPDARSLVRSRSRADARGSRLRTCGGQFESSSLRARFEGSALNGKWPLPNTAAFVT
jgi:hypothetical protein